MERTNPLPRTCGFTLVELAIVLVIIGLIVGGVLVGQDLIRAGEMRKQVSQINEINTAVNTFKLKYNCLPGDCTNATQFLGVDADGCGAYAYRSTTPSGTCNGNGDSRIGSYTHGLEMWRFYQQLGNAELLPGKYTGRCGEAGGTCAGWGQVQQAGVNVMAGAIPLTGLCVHSDDEWREAAGVVEWESKYFGNAIVIGHGNNEGSAGANGWLCRNPILTPLQTKQIDIKIDDGFPKTGIAQASGGNAYSFTEGSCMTGNTYQSGNSNACWMIITTSFK